LSLHGKPARAMRLLTTPTIGARSEELVIDWYDRLLGAQHQNVTSAVGDFVLRRADGWWAYQLAVVVDDAAQGITHVVRGQDIADNTARQLHLQRVLRLQTPIYLHTPLVLAEDGQKLSKQNGARALDIEQPLVALQDAGRVLGLQIQATDVNSWLASALNHWRARWLA
jgi:glutamyl-Q tRNA(Asp) synthetase